MIVSRLRRTTLLEKIILLGFYLSGFAALTYEQIWTQLLFLIFGTSTYAFSIMLTAFFIGLALGSHIMGRYVDRLSFPILWFSLIELGIGICGLVLLPAFSVLDIPYLMLFQNIKSPYLFMLSWFLLPFWLLIPTTLMGATLPLVSKIFASEREKIGEHVGTLYSANTFGGIVGSFSAGFLLIPYVGLVKTCVLAALSNIIVAFVIFFYSESLLNIQEIYKTRKARYFTNMRRGFYLFLVVSLFLCVYISSYKINPAFAGTYYAGMRMATIDEWKEEKANFNILYDKYGLYGLVVVGTERENLYLSVNGKTEASTAPSDTATQYLIAYVPMLVHENPGNVLNIGLGAGFTLSAIENFDSEKIDCIEIDPDIVKVADEYFSEYTDNVLDDPRLNMIIADGRNYLQTSEEKYDVIISEPSNPWISGEGSLFTKEFFEIVSEHLNEEGIFCQWAPMYEHNAEDFKILLNTFHSVFPYVQVYSTGTDIILLGSNQPMHISYPRLTEKLEDPEINRDFKEMFPRAIETTPLYVDEFLSTYKMDSDDVTEYLEGETRLNTDEHTILEFRTALNALKGRYSEGAVPLESNPLGDIIDFKTERYGKPIFVPPTSGTVDSSDSTDIIRILDVEVKKQPDWSLDTCGYEYMHMIASSDVFMYSSTRYARYMLPGQGLLVVTLSDVHYQPEIEDIENLIGDTFGFDSVEYMGDATLNGHTAHISEVSLKEGGVKGLSLAWYCSEKNALYMATVAYPLKGWNAEDAVEAISNIRCIHDTT